MQCHIAFQYDLRGYLIHHLAALLPFELRLVEEPFGRHGGKPFVVKIVLALPAIQYELGKGAHLIAHGAVRAVHIAGQAEDYAAGRPFFGGVPDVFRIALLIGYISLVGRIPDMRRVFQYHGSEHKTVYCHENDLPLTPKNAQQFTTLHPRCGTSFLLLTFFLSILFYSIIDVLILKLFGINMGAHFLLKVLRGLLLLPILAGISYEALKALAHAETPLTRALRWPGLQMQRLTTRQPTDQQLEVAIASMNAALHGLPEGDETTEEGWVIVHHPEYAPDS